MSKLGSARAAVEAARKKKTETELEDFRGLGDASGARAAVLLAGLDLEEEENNFLAETPERRKKQGKKTAGSASQESAAPSGGTCLKRLAGPDLDERDGDLDNLNFGLAEEGQGKPERPEKKRRKKTRQISHY